MTQEVGSPLLQLLVAACRRAELPVGSLFEGLAIRPQDLGEPDARLDWDDLAIILDRVLERAGSEARFEAMMAEGPRLMASGDRLRTLFPEVQTFFVWMVSSLSGLLFRNLQTSTRILGADRILWEHCIPRSYRPCRAFAIGSAGIFRGTPRIFGLPDAQVEGTFDERCGLYRILLPSPAERSAAARAAEDRTPGASGEPGRAATYMLEGVEHSPWFAKLGRVLLESQDLQALAFRLEAGLRHFAGCFAGSLWVLQAGGDMQCIRAWGTRLADPQVHILMLGTRVLGRAELPHGKVQMPQERQITTEMLGWAAIALDRILEAAKQPRTREVDASFVARLDLTSRQKQVLLLLVRGLSDKEIAQALGTSPKTVGHQVGALLRKGGVSCRTALASLCLNGHSIPWMEH